MFFLFFASVMILSFQRNNCAECPLPLVSEQQSEIDRENRVIREKDDRVKYEQALDLKIDRAMPGNKHFRSAVLAILAKNTEEHLADLKSREEAGTIERVSGWFAECIHGLLLESGYPVVFGKTPIYVSETDDEESSTEYPLAQLGEARDKLHLFASDAWSLHLSRNFYEAGRKAFDHSYCEDAKNGNVVSLIFTLPSLPCRIESQVPFDLMRQMYKVSLHCSAHYMKKGVYEQSIVGSDISQRAEEEQGEAAMTNPEMITGALLYFNLAKLHRTYAVWLDRISPPAHLDKPFDVWLLENNTKVNESCAKYHARMSDVEYNPHNYHKSDNERIAGFADRLPEPLGNRKVLVTVYRDGAVFKKITLSETEKFRINPL